jgi:hypothetical protein
MTGAAAPVFNRVMNPMRATEAGMGHPDFLTLPASLHLSFQPV